MSFAYWVKHQIFKVYSLQSKRVKRPYTSPQKCTILCLSNFHDMLLVYYFLDKLTLKVGESNGGCQVCIYIYDTRSRGLQNPHVGLESSDSNFRAFPFKRGLNHLRESVEEKSGAGLASGQLPRRSKIVLISQIRFNRAFIMVIISHKSYFRQSYSNFMMYWLRMFYRGKLGCRVFLFHIGLNDDLPLPCGEPQL